jgi:uncharacterized protein YqjF (DUF2071 family)
LAASRNWKPEAQLLHFRPWTKVLQAHWPELASHVAVLVEPATLQAQATQGPIMLPSREKPVEHWLHLSPV